MSTHIQHKCAECGAGMNDGEAKTFTVCDACWDKAHPKCTPTIEQTVRAQEAADNLVRPFKANGVQHLLTADELRRVLVEGEEQARLLGMSSERECDLRGKLERAQKERDQWRECARDLYMATHGPSLRDALARFDALAKEEEQ